MATVQDNINAIAVDALVTDALGKKWYTSKTLWANVVATVAIIAQIKYGFVFDPATQALVLSLVNLGLRKLTKEPIIW